MPSHRQNKRSHVSTMAQSPVARLCQLKECGRPHYIHHQLSGGAQGPAPEQMLLQSQTSSHHLP